MKSRRLDSLKLSAVLAVLSFLPYSIFAQFQNQPQQQQQQQNQFPGGQQKSPLPSGNPHPFNPQPLQSNALTQHSQNFLLNGESNRPSISNANPYPSVNSQNTLSQHQSLNPASVNQRNGNNKIPNQARFGPGPVIPNQNQYQSQNGFQQYNSQLQGGQTGMSYPQLQRDVSSSRSIMVNNPMRLDTTSSGINGAQVDFKLNSYSNPTFSLSNTTTCRCPISNCNYLSENCQNSCMFSFVTVIACYDQSVQYIQSDFYQFPSGAINSGNWTQQYTFYMLSRPVSVDVFVQHLGVVIDKTTAQLLYYNHLTLVDTFVVDMYAFNNNPNNQGGQALTLTGQQLGTQLSLQLNVQCINNMMGPMCDLSCNVNSMINGNLVLCYNNHTNVYWACQYSSYTNMATNCYVCTNGVFNGTCSGGYVVNQLGGVAYAFRTWTIVLGVLLGLACLLILCLILSYIICMTRLRNKQQSSQYSESNRSNNGSIRTNGGKRRSSEEQKLIDEEEWRRRHPQPPVVPTQPTHVTHEHNQSKSEYDETRRDHRTDYRPSHHQQDRESEYSDRNGGTYHQHVTTTVTRTSREHQV